MPLVKITRNGQLTLPAAIRKALNVAEGDHLEAKLTDGAVIFRPVSITRSGCSRSGTGRHFEQGQMGRTRTASIGRRATGDDRPGGARFAQRA